MSEPTGRRTPNRRGQGERLRAELVDAASALLAEVDSEETLSLRAVARRAKVAPQSVYLHFADRRALLTAVYQARFADLVAALAGAAEQPDVPAQSEPDHALARLRALCQVYVEYGQAHPGHYRVLFSTAGTPGWEPHELVGMPALEILDTAVRACLPGPAAGRDPGPSPATICLWAALHGLVTLRRDRPSFPWPDWDELIDQLIIAHTGHHGPQRAGR